MGKFKYDYKTCKKCWRKEKKMIGGKEYEVKILNLKECEKCPHLSECSANINLRVHLRLFGKI